MTIPILVAKLKNCCESSSGKSGATTPYSQDSTPNLDFKHLSETKFSSESDVKTAAENWLKGEGRDFCQAGFNKLVLRSDKCLNTFGDCVGK
ncbi:hypothetical protein AVEN_208125-1 [Araneus ventricosus]|uniref:Uncharacterized protein n=1 Tax=Araneus ventricosus TaxID=182803 RepID=A0A4Y2I1B4_ARAVE|nr:hypothetical protein AVEN_208125-1 [Araneus ventricosus]